MSDIFGAIGSVASAAIQADAIKSATNKQISALEKQRKFVYDELSPEKLQGAATDADVQKAQQSLALQAQTDPALLATRYATQNRILQDVNNLGNTANAVSGVAAQEAIRGVPGVQEAKQKLVDAALHELSLGASLPPDVQNELVQAGLEKTGMVTGSATAHGLGGHVLRSLIGNAGLQLKAQRQERAAALTQAAQGLEANRQSILQNLFPSLANTQLGTLQGQQSALQLSNNLMPTAGLSGADIANLWLARVGATNQLAQSSADAAARGGIGAAQAWQTGLGAATQYGAKALPSTREVFGF